MTGMKRWACVVRIGGIGDNLIASSVLPGLRARYDRIEVISKAPNHVVFENNPYIDKLVVLPEDEAPEDAVAWQRRWAKRALEYAGFYNLSHSCETALALLEGQTQFWWPAKVRRKLCDQSYLGFVHDICGVPRDFAPAFYPTDAEFDQAKATCDTIRKAKPGPIIGWCLSGSRIDKMYPFAHHAMARLINDLGANIVMLGAPNRRDFDMAKAIQEQVTVENGTDHGLHLALSPDPKAPSWPIRRILTQAQHCDLMISPDTGPAWAVAREPLPKIVLVSHASSHNITHGWNNTTTLHADQGRVPCWPCHRLHDSFDTCVKAAHAPAAACMADISVPQIVQAARRALGVGRVDRL